MNDLMGENVKIYRNVVVRESEIGSDTILADDVFVTGSKIGKRCTIERRGMVFGSEIGDYSYTGFNTVVKHAKIGRFCSVSWNVSIGGADHDLEKLTTHPFPFSPKYGITDIAGSYGSFEEELVIGNDVWIAGNVCITRGVHIGNGAVIGAGSVVTKDIPAYAVAYGNPAKVHRYRFDEKTIALLESLKWWDWPEDKLKDHIDIFRKPMDKDLLKILEEML